MCNLLHMLKAQVPALASLIGYHQTYLPWCIGVETALRSEGSTAQSGGAAQAAAITNKCAAADFKATPNGHIEGAVQSQIACLRQQAGMGAYHEIQDH